MPRKNGRLSPQEQRLIPAFVATGDVAEASRRAGYSSVTSAHHALARPGVQGEIFRLQHERITNEALPLAVDTLMSIMGNEKQPAGARVTAAKVVLDRVYGLQGGADGKEPHEMSAAELAAEIEKLKGIKADKARPVLEGQAEQVEAPNTGVFD